jgi:hypothetical protein
MLRQHMASTEPEFAYSSGEEEGAEGGGGRDGAEAASGGCEQLPAAGSDTHYQRLAALAALQPLSALVAGVPGIVEWKVGGFSPLVPVDGTLVAAGCMGRLGAAYRRSRTRKRTGDGTAPTPTQARADAARSQTVIALLRCSSGASSVGLILKPSCGFDRLRAWLLDAAAAGGGAGLVEGSTPCVAGDGRWLLNLECYVEKTKVPFLLKGAGVDAAAVGLGNVLPVLLHPRRLRWEQEPWLTWMLPTVTVASKPSPPPSTTTTTTTTTTMARAREGGMAASTPIAAVGVSPEAVERHKAKHSSFAAGIAGAALTCLTEGYLVRLGLAKAGAGALGWDGVQRPAWLPVADGGLVVTEARDLARRGELSGGGRARHLYNQRKHHRTKAKKARFASFATWIEATFTKALAPVRAGQPSGILDVAGGKGSLAFELALYRHLETTVIDTTPVKMSVFRSKQFLGHCLQRSTGSYDSATGDEDSGEPGDGHAPPPRLCPEVEARRRSRRAALGSLRGWLDVTVAADVSRAEQLTALDEVEGVMPLYQIRALFDDAFVMGSRTKADAGQGGVDTRALFQQSALVIGMHPDQATEPIVDACLSANKPFAVVPCCVFPEENLQRRTQDGLEVRSITQFVDYLVAKDPKGRVQTTTLPDVPGRNTVVYFAP